MSLKPLVNNKELWDDFCFEIGERIAFCHKQIEQRDEIHEIHRLQGEIKALRSLLQLRDKVNAKPKTETF